MNAATSSVGRGRRIAGTTIIFLGGLMLIASGSAKLAHIPQVVDQMAAMGLGGARATFVGFLEVGSALVFLIPTTRSIGLLLMSSFLGGAIATHLQHGESIAGPAVILLVIWLGSWLRHPEILWSCRSGSPVAGGT